MTSDSKRTVVAADGQTELIDFYADPSAIHGIGMIWYRVIAWSIVTKKDRLSNAFIGAEPIVCEGLGDVQCIVQRNTSGQGDGNTYVFPEDRNFNNMAEAVIYAKVRLEQQERIYAAREARMAQGVI